MIADEVLSNVLKAQINIVTQKVAIAFVFFSGNLITQTLTVKI